MDNTCIYIRIGLSYTDKFRMGTNCAPPVADLLLFCYERDFMTSSKGLRVGLILLISFEK